MTDHYTDAIRAGAAALRAPYRDPETVRAFVEEFPTLTAARVIEAALPHLREAWTAEQVAPGPCGATETVPSPYPEGPRELQALCDLRAGHAGQHEASSEQWGTFRWSTPAAVVEPAPDPWAAHLRCGHQLVGVGGVHCWATPGHPNAHTNGALLWNDRHEVVGP